MRLRINERYTINTKKTHPIIKLISIPIIAMGLAGIVGLVLFLTWFTWALLKL